MFANNFQDMLMIKTGAASFGKNMGKTMGASSDSQSLGNDFSAVLNSLMGKVSRSENIGEKNLMALMNIEEAPGQKTNKVIAALAAVLTGQQGAKSADLYVGPEGLDALGNLLKQAGFDADKVKSFILDKKQSMENENSTGASLQTLLPAIGEFMKENDQGTVLDISALPYVHAALNGFGFTPEKVENILVASTDKNQGIDVDKLLAELAPYTTAKAHDFSWTQSANGVGAFHNSHGTSVETKLEAIFSDMGTTFKSLPIDLTAAQRKMAMMTAIPTMNAATAETVLTTGSSAHHKMAMMAANPTMNAAAAETVLATGSSAHHKMAMMAANPTMHSATAETVLATGSSAHHKMAMMAASPTMHSATAETVLTTGSSAHHKMAMMAASPTMNAATAETVLDEAAKGEFSIDQFAAKLTALAEGRGRSTEKQLLADGFAKIFGENVHGVKKNMVTEGAKTFTSVETIDPKNAELRFDTKSPTPDLFTENAEGMFQGNLKGNDGENTWASENGAAAVDGKAGGNKQAGVLNSGVLRNGQGEKMTSDDSTFENISTLIEKTVKEKPFLTDEKGEMPVIPVRALAGSGIYGKISEVTQTNVSEKALPAYVTDQVAKQISKAIRNGDSEIKFHIKPPDMGRVELSITHTANGLKISILAEHSNTRDMLMNQASDLKSILADQGIRLEKMDVGMSGDFGGQSMAQAKHDSDQSNKGRKQKDKPVFSMDPLSNEPRQNAMGNLMAAGRYTRGKLDLVA